MIKPVIKPAWLQKLNNQAHWKEGGSWSQAAVPVSKGMGKGAGIHNSPLTRKVPPWLAAAYGMQDNRVSFQAHSKGGSSGTQARRQRVMQSRVRGTITDWNGSAGWIKPAEHIDHPDAKRTPKGLRLNAHDVNPKGHELSKGMEVTFFVFADGLGLGAENVIEYKGTFLDTESEKADTSRFPKLVEAFAERVAKGAGKGAGKVKGNIGKKGKGKKKGSGQREEEQAAGQTLPRERITDGGGLAGICVEWKGHFGWIEPSTEIDHPKAAKRNGRLFVHCSDLMGSDELEPGQEVTFHVYEDASGLGAEECIAVEE